MTLIDAPYAVEVHYIESDATTATFNMLNTLGVPYTAHLVAVESERRVLAKYGRQLMPTVLVWRGIEPYRHIYMSLEGFNPPALRTIHRILTEAALTAQLKEPA